MFDQRDIVGGRDCILFGSGPGLASWDDSLYPEALRLCCNSTIFSDTIKTCHYYFIQDNGGLTRTRNFVEPNGYCSRKVEYDKYIPIHAKYYGVGVNQRKKNWSLSLQDSIDGNASSYYLHTKIGIEVHDKIKRMESVIFTLIQFAVKNKCASLRFVGCDGRPGIRYNETVPGITDKAIWDRQWQSIIKYINNNNIRFMFIDG